MIFVVSGVVFVGHAGFAGESRGIRAVDLGVFEHGLRGRGRGIMKIVRKRRSSATKEWSLTL